MKRKENKQINFRVDEKEYERLKNMAEDIGMSLSGFCKSKVLGIKTRLPVVSHSDALQIASELRRIGVNVNQIAKHANIDGSVSSGKIERIREDLKVIWQLLS